MPVSVLLRVNMSLRIRRFRERLRQGRPPAPEPRPVPPRYDDCAVLVANSSHEMARAITSQLLTALPGCAIIYAPSLELTKHILRRRRIDLLVASPLLPDGRIGKLDTLLAHLAAPPDVVVVGEVQADTEATFRRVGYRATPVRRALLRQPKPSDKISVLGADLRNDLNNPLQEIVSMVFVAQASGDLSPTTSLALNAIDTAAQSMAGVVAKLEKKIRESVR